MVRRMKAEAPTIWQLHSEAERLSPASVRNLVLGGLGVLYALAVLLVARRAMGALTEELSWQGVAATALLSLALVSGLRVLWWRGCTDWVAAKPQPGWLDWGGSLVLVLIAGAVSLGGGQGAWAIWLPTLGADQWLRWRLSAGAKPQVPEKDEVQRVVRTRDDTGQETVVATLRADFVAGQRNATLYLGICPPLAGVPEISVAPVEGAEVKIVQALPHGAKLDVRLARVATEVASISLHVVARG